MIYYLKFWIYCCHSEYVHSYWLVPPRDKMLVHYLPCCCL